MNVRGKGVYIRETETDLVYDTHIFTIGSVQQLLLMARIVILCPHPRFFYKSFMLKLK